MKHYWITADGRKINIEDMATEHIIRCIEMTRKRGQTKLYFLTQGRLTRAKIINALEVELNKRIITLGNLQGVLWRGETYGRTRVS